MRSAVEGMKIACLIMMALAGTLSVGATPNLARHFVLGSPHLATSYSGGSSEIMLQQQADRSRRDRYPGAMAETTLMIRIALVTAILMVGVRVLAAAWCFRRVRNRLLVTGDLIFTIAGPAACICVGLIVCLLWEVPAGVLAGIAAYGVFWIVAAVGRDGLNRLSGEAWSIRIPMGTHAAIGFLGAIGFLPAWYFRHEYGLGTVASIAAAPALGAVVLGLFLFWVVNYSMMGGAGTSSKSYDRFDHFYGRYESELKEEAEWAAGRIRTKQ